MKTMTTDDWKADELHSGDVELTKKVRGSVIGSNNIPTPTAPCDGPRIIIKVEDRAALAALLAGKSE